VLLAAGADGNAQSVNGHTPLHCAASEGRVEAMGLLLDAGAKVNERNKYGKTALDLARNNDCRALLRQAGGKTGAELAAEPPPPPAPTKETESGLDNESKTP